MLRGRKGIRIQLIAKMNLLISQQQDIITDIIQIESVFDTGVFKLDPANPLFREYGKKVVKFGHHTIASRDSGLPATLSPYNPTHSIPASFPANLLSFISSLESYSTPSFSSYSPARS